MKWEKPFSGFKTNMSMSLKEKWRIALHDPAYLIIISLVIFMFCLIYFERYFRI